MEPEARVELEKLEVLVGQWELEAIFPQAPADADEVRGRAIFEWGPERAFLVQRWEISIPEAPDGVAIIALDEDNGRTIQHYFDSRGVVRRYELGIEDGTWALTKVSPGWAQCFRGQFSPSGETVEGAWEKSDDGAEWEHDFRLIYRRVS